MLSAMRRAAPRPGGVRWRAPSGCEPYDGRPRAEPRYRARTGGARSPSRAGVPPPEECGYRWHRRIARCRASPRCDAAGFRRCRAWRAIRPARPQPFSWTDPFAERAPESVRKVAEGLARFVKMRTTRAHRGDDETCQRWNPGRGRFVQMRDMRVC